MEEKPLAVKDVAFEIVLASIPRSTVRVMPGDELPAAAVHLDDGALDTRMGAAFEGVGQPEIEGVESSIVIGRRDRDQEIVGGTVPGWTRCLDAGGKRVTLACRLGKLDPYAALR